MAGRGSNDPPPPEDEQHTTTGATAPPRGTEAGELCYYFINQLTEMGGDGHVRFKEWARTKAGRTLSIREFLLQFPGTFAVIDESTGPRVILIGKEFDKPTGHIDRGRDMNAQRKRLTEQGKDGFNTLTVGTVDNGCSTDTAFCQECYSRDLNTNPKLIGIRTPKQQRQGAGLAKFVSVIDSSSTNVVVDRLPLEIFDNGPNASMTFGQLRYSLLDFGITLPANGETYFLDDHAICGSTPITGGGDVTDEDHAVIRFANPELIGDFPLQYQSALGELRDALVCEACAVSLSTSQYW